MQVVRVHLNGKWYLIPVSAHWANIGKNGFVKFRGKRLTTAQKGQTLQQWANQHNHDLQAVLDLEKADGTGPMTWGAAISLAKKHGVVLTPELKSNLFAHAEVAERMVARAQGNYYPMWSMALLAMPRTRGKCEAMRKAGGQFALIFGGVKPVKPKNWKAWCPKPNQVWGPKSAKAWL